MHIDELREFQLDFEKSRKNISDECKELFRLRDKFVKDFNPQFIASLSIDQYVIGKGLPSFCHRIENELNEWGNIHGSTAKKFGIYYGVSGKDKEKKYRIGKAIFGDQINEAFNSIKESILQLTQNPNDFPLLISNPISPMFKGKILSIYHQNKFLNIYSASHLNHFIDRLCLANDSKSELVKQKTLLNFKNNDAVMKDWSNFEFNRFLYHSFGKPDSDEKDNDVPIVLGKYKSLSFPPIETVSFEFIDLETTPPTNKIGNKKKKEKTTDFNKRGKRLKRIGDRGEQIVLRAEHAKLVEQGREDLAKKIDHIAKRDDSAGYDIVSYDNNGLEKYIEVKSTVRPTGSVDIFISSNELSVAEDLENYYIYIVFSAGGKEAKIWPIKADYFINDPNIKPVPIQYKIKVKTT